MDIRGLPENMDNIALKSVANVKHVVSAEI